jgi:hypothetical protein
MHATLTTTAKSSPTHGPLTPQESTRLAELEPIIERGLTAFLEVGTALLEINDKRLYRQTHSTFKEYVEERWKMSARHAYRLCESAEVIRSLPEKCDQLVTTESQVRELAKVEPDQRVEVLRVASSKGRVTAKSIQEAANITEDQPDDVVMTPLDVARDVVNHFEPSGRILDPCRGRGAFADLMPGSEWCEVSEGRDFYQWNEPVNWIVSNPPYSIFAEFLRHSFDVADDIVYLIPVNKVFNSDRIMREIWTWGGVAEIYVVAGGAALNFPIGFCIGAVHFKRNYRGGIRVTFRNGRTAA